MAKYRWRKHKKPAGPTWVCNEDGTYTITYTMTGTGTNINLNNLDLSNIMTMDHLYFAI